METAPVELSGDQWRRRVTPPPGSGAPADPILADHRPLAALVAERAGPVAPPPPFVVGVTGGVAAGKSVTARTLADLLAADHRLQADVVTTDGFLLSNQVLAERGLTDRKGFPESYDQARLVAFLIAVRAGQPAEAPVYDHERYDVLAGPGQRVDHPDVLVVEGVNVLQTGPQGQPVADLLDFSVYVDADEADLHHWFLTRMRALRADSVGDPDSFFAGFAGFSDDEFTAIGDAVWTGINRPNLVEHIAPTRERADLVLEKAPDHTVRRVVLRRP